VDALALPAVTAATKLPERCVLTPNLGELASLDGGSDDSPETQARRVAERTGAVVATQDWVAAPGGELWHNTAGTVGLATSGSGDVLAGAVLGLLCRGATPAQAACWATYAHSAAGQRLAAQRGRTGYLARELIDVLPSEMVALTS
jgi:NAD(P)H-hydrate repair Nnr-like enzyme with NAD(P)H-hydrate dehydratase domain